MKEHLVIRNFGSIREAEIDIQDLTVLVGPQATGKSLAAQALYFLRGLEELLFPDDNASPGELETVMSTLGWWLGNKSSVYAGPGTLLSWHPAKPSAETAHEIRWEQDKIHLSEMLESRVRGWLELYVRAEHPPKALGQVYIPAGRTLYSFLPHTILRSRHFLPISKQWPGYVLTFYGTLETAIEQLWHDQEQGHLTPFDGTPEAIFLRQKVDSILKGQIQYGPETILLETGEKQLRPATIAAEQMEIWPFWALVESGHVLEEPHTQVYFEEPEAHLHPGAQRSVMEIIANLVRQGVRFLLTTHSPYILHAVNSFLMAQKALDAGQALPADTSQETALRSEQVAVYRFSSDGNVYDIMDAEAGLIAEDELSRVAGDMGDIFTRLQEQPEEKK
jgi:hypothetical protein